jgi:hypothetical protein
VATHTEIRRHYVSEMQHGVYNVTLGAMVSLADAVGVRVWCLLRPTKRRSLSRP